MIVINLCNIPKDFDLNQPAVSTLIQAVVHVTRSDTQSVNVVPSRVEVLLVSKDGLIERARIMAVIECDQHLLTGAANAMIYHVFQFLKSTGLAYCPFVEIRTANEVPMLMLDLN